MEDEPIKRGFKIFGRDVSDIPCFRNSFLYGISGGIVVGMLTFLGTSRTMLSTHVGFGTFCCSTLTYWGWCRYRFHLRSVQYLELQEALRNKVTYEGTDVEEKFEI